MVSIEGEYGTGSQGFQLVKGNNLNLTFRIKNIGGVSIAPYYWMRVHEGSVLSRTGDKVLESTGQMVEITVGTTKGITFNVVDNGPLGKRDVFLSLYTATEKAGKIEGGEDEWQDAYEVVAAPVVKVQILDLTIS